MVGQERTTGAEHRSEDRRYDDPSEELTPSLADALVRLAQMAEQMDAAGRRPVTAAEAGELIRLVVVSMTALLEGRERRGPTATVDLTERGLVVARDRHADDSVGERSTMWTVEPSDPPSLDVEPLVRSEVVDLIQKLNRLL